MSLEKIPHFAGNWKTPWKDRLTVNFREHGGGCGRLLFAIGVIVVLNMAGIWVGFPWWVTALVLVGFWWVRICRFLIIKTFINNLI